MHMKLALSASFFDSKAVREHLDNMDLIITTNTLMVPVLDRLLRPRVLCMSGEWHPTIRNVEAFVRLINGVPAGEQLDLEITTGGDLLKIATGGRGKYAPCDCAGWSVYSRAIDSLCADIMTERPCAST